MSLANGEEGRSANGPGKRAGTAGAPSVITAEGDDADAESEDDEEDAAGPGVGGGRVPLYEGGQMTAEQLAEERERKRILYEVIPEEHRTRLASFQRSKLKTADVRRLVNQVLGQSVPQNVVLVVSAYAKMFAGMLVEDAREVQGEWTAVEEKRADEQQNPVLEKLRKAKHVLPRPEESGRESGEAVDDTQPDANGATSVVVQHGLTSPEQTQPTTNGLTNGTHHDKDDADGNTLHPGGAGGLLKDIEECDRGPLLPDHLREALRRYKKRRTGGTVGFTGLSLEGRENTAPRMGGKKLFR